MLEKGVSGLQAQVDAYDEVTMGFIRYSNKKENTMSRRELWSQWMKKQVMNSMATKGTLDMLTSSKADQVQDKGLVDRLFDDDAHEELPFDLMDLEGLGGLWVPGQELPDLDEDDLLEGN